MVPVSFKQNAETRSEGGPENCPDCLAQLSHDIVGVENLARELKAEYEAARAKTEGADSLGVGSGSVRAEGSVSQKGEGDV